MSKKGGYNHIIAAARQSGMRGFTYAFENWAAPLRTVEEGLTRPPISSEDMSKYPRAREAAEIKASQLYKALNEEE